MNTVFLDQSNKADELKCSDCKQAKNWYFVYRTKKVLLYNNCIPSILFMTSNMMGDKRANTKWSN